VKTSTLDYMARENTTLLKLVERKTTIRFANGLGGNEEERMTALILPPKMTVLLGTKVDLRR
jgi:hypothetical protein